MHQERRPPTGRPRRVHNRPDLDGVLQERVGPALLPDRGGRSVARIDTGIISKREQDGTDLREQPLEIPARKIRGADRAGEERVADDEILARLTLLADLEADP